MAATSHFRVGLTRDFLNADGELVFGEIGLDALKSHPGVSVEFLPDYGDELPATVGRDFAAPLEMQFVAHDPFALSDDAAALGVELLGLDQLLSEADFICVCCALTAAS